MTKADVRLVSKSGKIIESIHLRLVMNRKRHARVLLYEYFRLQFSFGQKSVSDLYIYIYIYILYTHGDAIMIDEVIDFCGTRNILPS
jgi:hypothetical protein